MSRSSSSLAAAKFARTHSHNRPFKPLQVLAGLALVAWLTNATYAIDIVAIEEHWSLSLGQPDTGSSSPQVTMVMSPNGHLDSQYFVFTVNHHSVPGWIPGGLQVQYWNGEDVVDSKVGPQEGTLAQTDEVVTWVQRTTVNSGQLGFEIKSGTSTSWGQFGGLGHLKFSVATSLANLNGYRPAVSIEGSGVNFGGNRVKNLTLTKLRWYDSLGNVYELNAPIDVDADLDP
jgi:hypothetical protein